MICSRSLAPTVVCPIYLPIRFLVYVTNGAFTVNGVCEGGITVSSRAAHCFCLADGNFIGFELWNQARAKGADLLWRIKKNLRLPRASRFPDGPYLSRIYPLERDWRHKTNGVQV